MEKKMPQVELTPELADKIWKNIQAKIQRERDSKDEVLHHLKQLKAQMGKRKKYYNFSDIAQDAVSDCIIYIDQKIAKIKNQ